MTFEIKSIIQTMVNGSSEMVINLSMAIVGILFNYQLMKYSGENGVAAYGVIQAVALIYMGMFQGYSIGVIPVIGYQFGAGNKEEIRSLLAKSLRIVSCMGVILFIALEMSVGGVVKIFVGYDDELSMLSANGLRIYSTVMLFAGLNIFASGFFTALNDGLNSALISFVRTMVFLVAFVLLLPVFFGINGIWISTTAAEVLAVIVSAVILIRNRDRYTVC
ncbi:MAG: MATE family efflux transporter [Eubacteriales bacterium]|nr:MATE family efflux transporter [Eubacteriales bacterium]